MNRKYRLMLLAAFWYLGLAVATAAPGLKEANEYYAAGDFQTAATTYEALIAKGGPDAALYYNLGNARQQLKQYGPAILAYERARLLSPRDPDVLANLTQARKAAAAFEDTGSHGVVHAMSGYFSRNEWSWLVAGSSLALGVLLLLAGSFGFPRRWMPRAASAIAVAAILVISVGSAALWLRRGEAKRGIVTSGSAVIRLSPFVAAESLGTPVAGSVVHLGAKNSGFHYVELPGSSLKGWLSVDDVAPVLPE